MDSYEEIIDLINEFYQIHCSFSERYYRNDLGAHPNLWKIYNEDFENNKDNFSIILNYRNIMIKDKDLKRQLGTCVFKHKDCERYRYKLDTTIMDKVESYYKKEDHIGKICIAKTINDLCGVRIICPNVRGNDKIQKILQSFKDDKIIKRYYTKDKHRYKAIHCYFQLKNNYFPWELQIWDEKDAQLNHYLHEEHEKRRKEVLQL